MNHLRKQILFLCDSLILIVFSTFFSWFSLRYNLTDAVGQSVQLIQNFALLYACTVLFQLLFRTYDSLWRYAESKEYLSLLMAAFCGFFLYEVLSRIFLEHNFLYAPDLCGQPLGLGNAVAALCLPCLPQSGTI